MLPIVAKEWIDTHTPKSMLVPWDESGLPIALIEVIAEVIVVRPGIDKQGAEECIGPDGVLRHELDRLPSRASSESLHR
jgi:hypothetical protein